MRLCTGACVQPKLEAADRTLHHQDSCRLTAADIICLRGFHVKTAAYSDVERLRLRALDALHLLHTEPEERFDRITRLTRGMFDVPYALINFVADRYQWTKSASGTGLVTLARERSICASALHETNLSVVPDLAADSRFVDHPLVLGQAGTPPVRFYAGRRLLAPDGHPVGTLCILDIAPRLMSEDDLALLDDLGAMAEREIAEPPPVDLDEQTGLADARGLDMLATPILTACRMSAEPVSLIRFDLQPVVGKADEAERNDSARIRFADMLVDTYRQSDVAACLAPGQFVLLAARCEGQSAERMVRRLRLAIDAFHRTSNTDYALVFDYGIATAPADCDDRCETLLAHAERRLAETRRPHDITG